MTPHVCVPGPWPEDLVTLPDGARHHLSRVLRLRDESAVTYTDGAGAFGKGILSGNSIRRGEESVVERPRDLEIVVAAPHRAERSRFLVEKLTELGVTRITWLHTARSQKPPPSKADAWAIQAVEQSRRAWLPQISGPVRVEDLAGAIAVAHPGAPPADWEVLAGAGVSFVVGPEGGLTPDELDVLASRQIAQFGLGSATLRTETAAIAIAVLATSAQSPW